MGILLVPARRCGPTLVRRLFLPLAEVHVEDRVDLWKGIFHTVRSDPDPLWLGRPPDDPERDDPNWTSGASIRPPRSP